MQRLGLLIEAVLLVEVGEDSYPNLVIFINFIDKAFSLNFSCNDFFALICFCLATAPIFTKLIGVDF